MPKIKGGFYKYKLHYSLTPEIGREVLKKVRLLSRLRDYGYICYKNSLWLRKLKQQKV